MMLRLRYIYICAILTCTLLSASGQIAALRGDERYENLLLKVQKLEQQEQKIEREIKRNVELFKRGGDSVSIYREQIVNMEQSLFDLRVSKGAVQGDINQIEQKWMFDNPDSKVSRTTQPLQTKDDRAKSISQSSYAQQNLSTSELESLHEAEQLDKRLDLKFSSYISNYRELSRLSRAYAQSSSPEEAEGIARKYAKLDSLNLAIASRSIEVWSHISDNKNFAYTLLVEGLGAEDIFDREQRMKVRSAEMVDSLSATTQCQELLSYYVGRLSMVEYELLIAQRLQLFVAADSLKYVRDSIQMAGFSYAPTQIRERLFIDYEPIKFSTKAVYTGANPIPNGKVYDRGVIYRLLVGAFKSRQAASLFRGAYPISIIKDESGDLAYYLGGYKSFEEAEEARKVLLKRGFRRPEVMEWRDGQSRNLTRDPRTDETKYRVEITGVAELTAELKSVIETQGAGRELTKVDVQTFVVGLFDDILDAERLLESIKVVNSAVEVSIVEIK